MRIESDADLPRCLSTRNKQFRRAKQLAAAQFNKPAKKAYSPDIQGFFSRTAIVTFADKTEVVVQFRIEPLDFDVFNTARKALGPVVPEIGKIEDEELLKEGIQVVWMTRVPGKTWFHGSRGKDPRIRIKILSSLAGILSKGQIGDCSDEVVDTKIRPHLEMIISSDDEKLSPYREIATKLLAKVAQLKEFPLFIAHFDLNDVNIMIDDKGNVSGLVDWELSSPLPFGVGFGRLHTLAGEYSGGEFHIPDEFAEAELAFWDGLLDGVSDNTRDFLHRNIESLQTAMTLGTLLDSCALENGKLLPLGDVVENALPKLMTYRIPAIRASNSPYAV